jgi:hypothetical protein
MAMFFALLCTRPLFVQAAAPQAECRFEPLAIAQGMTRQQVERQIAALRGETSSYSVYQNGLRGGVVNYRLGACVLQIDYAPGALPPYVIGPGGVTQHLAPIDETVKAFSIQRERAAASGLAASQTKP